MAVLNQKSAERRNKMDIIVLIVIILVASALFTFALSEQRYSDDHVLLAMLPMLLFCSLVYIAYQIWSK